MGGSADIEGKHFWGTPAHALAFGRMLRRLGGPWACSHGQFFVMKVTFGPRGPRPRLVGLHTDGIGQAFFADADALRSVVRVRLHRKDPP
jgi:hypothetical protein